jgi:hypothetical protein
MLTTARLPQLIALMRQEADHSLSVDAFIVKEAKSLAIARSRR